MFFFPSLFEGLPVVLVEAQASGLPCLISDTISEEAILTPGVVVKKLAENSKQWADTAIEMLVSDYDRMQGRSAVQKAV